MKVNVFKGNHCPHCGCSLNAASNQNDETPEPGDLTLCAKCRNWIEFNDDMKLIKTTDEHINEIDKSDKIELKRFIEKYFND